MDKPHQVLWFSFFLLFLVDFHATHFAIITVWRVGPNMQLTNLPLQTFILFLSLSVSSPLLSQYYQSILKGLGINHSLVLLEILFREVENVLVFGHENSCLFWIDGLYFLFELLYLYLPLLENLLSSKKKLRWRSVMVCLWRLLL